LQLIANKQYWRFLFFQELELKIKLYDFTKGSSCSAKRRPKQSTCISKIDLMLEEFMKKVYLQKENTNDGSPKEMTCLHDRREGSQSTKAKLKQHIMRDHLPKYSQDQTTTKIKADEISNSASRKHAKKLCRGLPVNPDTNFNEIQTNNFVDPNFGPFQNTDTTKEMLKGKTCTSPTVRLETSSNTNTGNFQSSHTELILNLDDSLIDLFEDHSLSRTTKAPEDSMHFFTSPTNTTHNDVTVCNEEGCLSPVSATASMLESLLRKSQCASDLSMLEASTESTSGLR
jgi:hypothetical protein